MNYIILNGQSSEDIQGLIIQSLPPISKPAIRANIEEIDGRDGDLVTKLGYSAYDKEISIGLSYNYDIDEIISFFNSEGTVTFSNEDEKYYNYQILNQIDFEKLLRFKTATVTMHVQPFKYSTTEGVRTFSIDEGNSINISNHGNYISKPIMTITGTGTINLSLNNYQIFVIELGTNEQITIDTNLMEAYNQESGSLMNRQVSGNYDNFVLNVGQNVISWSGNVSVIQIENYSRWV